MEMKIRFAGKKKVSAEFNGLQIITDQPKENGGEGSAPGPFEMFLASLGTCAGVFVMTFCEKRGIPLDGIELTERIEWNKEKHLVSKIDLKITVPPSFPEKYRESLVHAANLCTVKRHLKEPPEINLETVVH